MRALPNNGMHPNANHLGFHRELAANHGSSRRVMPGVRRLRVAKHYWLSFVMSQKISSISIGHSFRTAQSTYIFAVNCWPKMPSG